jgi:DNA modification methylase
MTQIGNIGTDSRVIQGDAREVLRSLPENSVHCCITSPPYWSLRRYLADDHPDKAREIGMEDSLDAHVANLVAVFREVRRVLHPSGIAWVNYGDAYAGARMTGGTNAISGIGKTHPHNDHLRETDLEPKQLLGLAWRLAFALQADGWWLRSCVIWHKPNVMPGPWARPICDHEYVFLLAKSADHFYDKWGEREKAKYGYSPMGYGRFGSGMGGQHESRSVEKGDGGDRAIRTVWEIPTESFSGAHFATFPRKLVERCLKLGVSAKGCCPKCLSPWERIVEITRSFESGSGRSGNKINGKQPPVQGGGMTLDIRRGPVVNGITIGWEPTCKCAAGEPIPVTVCDPFAGSGTVGVVARQMGYNFVGCELNQEYVAMAERRIAEALIHDQEPPVPLARGQMELFE